MTVLLLSSTVLFIWFNRPDAAAHAAFGLYGSALVLVLAMVTSVVATVFTRLGVAVGLRWCLFVALALLAVATAVLGYGHLSRSAGVPEAALGIFLFVVALALVGTVLTLTRTPAAD